MQRRGFTLLEVMIASALGVIVLTTGLVVGTQMQKRALFEEQTMMAQVTGRAVKELFTTDLARAGTGMGNTPISFNTDDERSAITVWHKPDLQSGAGTTLSPDADFQAAPTEALKSDALQLYWGETSGMLTLAECAPPDALSYRTSDGNSFCTTKNPSHGLEDPLQPTLAVLVSGGNKMACPVRVSTITDGSPGKLTIHPPNLEVPRSPTCDALVDSSFWKPSGSGKTDVENWLALRLGGAAYRVNWKNNIPTLEYQAPGQAAWSVVSRDVEQMIVREGIIDLENPKNALTWYPDAPPLGVVRPPISECTVADFNAGPCKIDLKGHDGVDLASPANDPELRKRMRQRLRELEVTLVIRTRRINQDAVLGGQDEEGHDRDGYKRRRFTFRILARNFAAVGMLRKVVKDEDVVTP